MPGNMELDWTNGCPYHPEQGKTCRGCPDSMDPYVFDGGCGRHLQPDALQREQAAAQARYEARIERQQRLRHGKRRGPMRG